MRLNINADLGESYGCFTIGNDEALLGIVGTANIACGLHGGDPKVMRDTVLRAREAGVSIGAHPGYADLHGFGRRPMTLSDQELEALLVYQIGAVAAMGRFHNWPISHIKPHGALNNQAHTDARIAKVIAQTIARCDPTLILLAPVLSTLAAEGEAAGLTVALEAFADRTYEADGQLTPRNIKGAVLEDSLKARDHVMRMVDAGGIVTRTGQVLPTVFHSVCVHGDGPAAIKTAQAVRDALNANGHKVERLDRLFSCQGYASLDVAELS